jgi:hypothetical protein
MAKKTIENSWRDRLQYEIIYKRRFAIIKKLPTRWVFFEHYYQMIKFYPKMTEYTAYWITVPDYDRKELIAELDKEELCIQMLKDPHNVIL